MGLKVAVGTTRASKAVNGWLVTVGLRCHFKADV